MSTPTTKDLFSSDFIEEMKEILLKSKTELEEKLNAYARKSPSETDEPDGTFPEYGDEEDDNVHEIEEFVVNQSLKAEFEKQLRDVDEALQRMEEGTYGICKYSGEKISEERLRIRPTSSSTVEVKKAFRSEK